MQSADTGAAERIAVNRAKGDFMRNQRSKSSDQTEIKTSSEPDVGYAPKSYSRKENIILFLKMAAVALSILAMMWLV
jgi:hypothetical protein